MAPPPRRDSVERVYIILTMKFSFDRIALGLLAAAVTASIYLSFASPIARAVRNGETINAVVLGTDLVDYARHTDTIIFLSYAPAVRFLNIISIPRDTRFSPQGYHFNRVNEVYAYHYRTTKNDHHACRETAAAVEQLLDSRVAIPYYLQIDYNSFRAFIDSIGGITLDIDEPMHHDDAAGNLHIHFEPGRQHLSGQQALEYVRYRGPAGDIGRVFRQQQFLKAALSRFKNPLSLIRLPQIVASVTGDIRTNLTFWDMMVLALEARALTADNIRLAQLPGTPQRNYWNVDADNRRGMLDQILPSTGTAVAAGPLVRVEVWNASGTNRLADTVNWMLREQGFDVVEWGTLSVVQKKTLIKDLTGNLRAAQQVAGIIGCGEVITRYDNKRFADIAVTLGEDCAGLAKRHTAAAKRTTEEP